MANYYLQDANGAYYQLAITNSGQPYPIRVGVQSIVPLYLVDTGSQTWQLGITPLGQFTLTAVSSHAETPIILTAPDGKNYMLDASTLGQITEAFNYTLSLSDAQGPKILYYYS